MNKQHWQDWVNFVLGLWVIVSPWTLGHVMVGPEGVTEAVMWNHYVIGTVVVIIAIAAVYTFNAWLEWTNIVLGAWLLLSPWGLGFTGSTGLLWNAVITGLLIIVFAGWTLAEEQGPKQLSKRARS